MCELVRKLPIFKSVPCVKWCSSRRRASPNLILARADDVKIYKKIDEAEDSETLQSATDFAVHWELLVSTKNPSFDD